MKKNLFKSLLSLTLLFASAGVMAQTVNGTVSSEDGPLPGATVQVQGTDRGVSTDFDGNFSIQAGADDVLVVSFVGFASQSVAVNGQDQITVTLMADNELEEVVITGYGSQKSKEITSAVVKVTSEEFNKGTINNANQLLQGKVAGLSIYNRGGNPNSPGVVRLRGISTVGANVSPLVVVDGIIGASLDNVDPADIETINVLKDGSASAIYGSRGSAGVILVTTKRGADGDAQFEYNGQFATSQIADTIDVLTASEFTSGSFGLQGFNAGSTTDWLDAVSRDATSMIHNFSVSGGQGNTVYRLSANLREVEGVMLNSGFDQFNTRASIQTTALNDKLKVSFNTSYTKRDQQNGFNEAFRYALLYNPSAPIYAADAPAELNVSTSLYGGFFESEGLFDSFNPVSILEQNINEGERTEFNYGLNLDYDFSENLSATVNIANQSSLYSNREYYAPTSLFRGNATSPVRKGEARFFDNRNTFKLYEVYGRYNNNFGNVALAVTGGYSFQQNNYSDKFFSLGDFPSNNDFNYLNAIEVSQDLQAEGFISANSSASPDEKIIAMFGRANVTIDDAIFINASVRREGSTKLGENNKWGIFPAFGLGVDMNKYLNLGADKFKVRVGYGVTGALPGQSGLTRDTYNIVSDALGNFNSVPAYAGNPDLKWEEKAETNIGIEFRKGIVDVTFDYFTRDIKDFILNVPSDVAVTGFPSITTNAGSLETNGVELAVNLNLVDTEDTKYSTGIVLSNNQSKLTEYIFDGLTTRANLGAPGQNSTNLIKVKVGDPIGDIWGPVYAGSVDANGNQVLVDVNNDGQFITGGDQGQNPDADFDVLGNGIPTLELGWSNNLTIGEWNINAFFRGAFGHSLVNSFRAFYEPRVATQGSYNLVNTSLAINELSTPQFSSLYVEKADFLKLDNLTISRRINTGITGIDAFTLALSGQNLFVISDYTGTDPEPALIDTGSAANGDAANGDGLGADVLAPGIDRRNNYFFSRTFTLGVNVKF
ncbi:MAG: SusC/RagA family TonB-linked outer membrane protein [Flavobacteriaceae bacterium]